MKAVSLALSLALAGCAGTADLRPELMDQATFDRELARRFQYPPPSPGPVEVEDSRAGQMTDAGYFARFLDYDRSYSRSARAEARRLITRLQAEAGDLNHEQFVLRVAEIAALADNAHTGVSREAWMKNTPRMPLRTYLFADGLHVLRTSRATAALLGARIDRIEGRSAEEIFRRIRRYAGGTEARRRTQLIPMLESPGLLVAAGLASDRRALTISGVLSDGTPFERRVEAEERDRAAQISNTAQLLFPNAPRTSFLQDHGALPVSLRNSGDLFRIDDLPHGGVYVRMAHNGDPDEGEIATFLNAVNDRVRSDRPGFVVLDMRMNGGGDYTTTYAFARAFPEVVGPAGRIYVLTSPFTFSAAITTVAALKDAGGSRVTLVGEEVGDRLSFWAEGQGFSLPNAFFTVFYATAKHDYGAPCRDRSICFWLNDRYPVRVASLAPDIEAPMTFAAYRAGRDPALEAVLHRETER